MNTRNHKIFLIPKPITKPRVRIFCFPFAGGSASTYMSWMEKLRDQVELVLVQPPGRGHRISERPHDNMRSLVDELMTHSSYITDVPYVLFGHSLGGRVAYELSYRLNSVGKRLPEYLVASASRPPHTAKLKDRIYDLPKDEFVHELKTLNGTPEEVLSNQDLMDFLIPLLRADFKISDTYKGEKKALKFPILVLSGEQDSSVTQDQLAAWEELSSVECNFIKLQGDHFFINHRPNSVIDQVSKMLNEILQKLPDATYSSVNEHKQPFPIG